MSELKVITGDFNSGKTERLMEIYRNQEKGTADGFACIKDFSNETGEFSGYSLKWLSSGITFPLAVLKEKIKEPIGGYFEFDRFLFSESAFFKASLMIKSLLLNPDIRTVFIDEIGMLELMGKGYSHIFSEALSSDKNVYAVINKKNIEKVIKAYNVKNYLII